MNLKDRVDPSRAAVIVVDVQNDFCHPEGSWGRSGKNMDFINEMIPALQKFVTAARRQNVPIIFIQTTHSDADSTSAWLSRKSQSSGDPNQTCVEGTWGCGFYGVLPEEGDLVVRKHRYSAFVGTNLAQILNALGRDSILATGVATNVCVESTVRDGLNRDFHILLVSDCTATTSDAAQKSTEENIRNAFGWVDSSKVVCSIWDSLTVVK
ncbi:cysteine hydrolase family protein [Alicyclobacillus fastidiosus]|uniref:Cysteine hydrolase n=1 Tax=Alicyclobacillus fastidiosus TaxID=392011 RepID=A0ABV5AC28_9BACL|nr:cysteine hydrolase [Alicyclobacillus fastidiosus]WEH11474.1 cysteine hydrolase [Alicyclobacillus fastidiosus]